MCVPLLVGWAVGIDEPGGCLLGAWWVHLAYQLSLPGWAWLLVGCVPLLASWAVGIGEPVGCFGIHLAVIRQPLHQRWMEPSQLLLGRGCTIGGGVTTARWENYHQGASARDSVKPQRCKTTDDPRKGHAVTVETIRGVKDRLSVAHTLNGMVTGRQKVKPARGRGRCRTARSDNNNSPKAGSLTEYGWVIR